LLTGLSLEEVLAALDAVGESLTAEDRVPPDAAELAALELGRVVVFSPSALGGWPKWTRAVCGPARFDYVVPVLIAKIIRRSIP